VDAHGKWLGAGVGGDVCDVGVNSTPVGGGSAGGGCVGGSSGGGDVVNCDVVIRGTAKDWGVRHVSPTVVRIAHDVVLEAGIDGALDDGHLVTAGGIGEEGDAGGLLEADGLAAGGAEHGGDLVGGAFFAAAAVHHAEDGHGHREHENDDDDDDHDFGESESPPRARRMENGKWKMVNGQSGRGLDDARACSFHFPFSIFHFPSPLFHELYFSKEYRLSSPVERSPSGPAETKNGRWSGD